MKKIAFITPTFGMTSYVVELAEEIANSNFHVDVYYQDNSYNSFNISKIHDDNLSFFPVSIDYKLITIKNYEKYFKSFWEIISNKIIISGKYDLLLGIDKDGLILSSRLSKKFNIPYFYWSLELYEKDHKGWNSWMPYEVCEFLCNEESNAYINTSKVIVQEEDRGKYLDKILNFENKNKIYFPVCIKKTCKEKKNYFLYDLCNIPYDKKILLLFGNHRMKDSWIMDIVNSLSDPWVLVLHGLREEETKKNINHNQLFISHKQIINSDIQRLISSSDIGLVHYENNSTNDILTAWSSEKIARYLDCGLPIIAHNVGNFPKFFNKYNCGFSYNFPKEVGELVNKIDKNYSYFSSNAKKAFIDYSFDEQCKNIINEITTITNLTEKEIYSYKTSSIKLSVIIPTLNRCQSLENVLKCLVAQDLAPEIFEILVIDNGSEDSTKEIVNKYINEYPSINIKFLTSSPKGLLSGRQEGIKKALGDVLTFLDDDIITWQGFLSSILETFQNHPDVVIAGGPCTPQYEEIPPIWVESFNNKNVDYYRNGYLSICNYGKVEKEISPKDIWGLNFSIKKDILTQFRGFFPDGVPEEKLIFRGSGESGITDLLEEKGFKGWYSPKICVSHVIPKKRLTKEYFLKRAFSQGISESYQDIRENGYISNKKLNYKNDSTIDNQIYNSYVDGYLFHRKVSSKNINLLSWILKKDYLNYEYPNQKLDFSFEYSVSNLTTKKLIENIKYENNKLA